MIILLVEAEGEVRQYVLVGSMTQTLGRRDCSILLPSHRSISRHHASITVLPTPASNATDLAATPTVLLADSSKHGTFVNGELLTPNDPHRPLKPTDRIEFGTCVSASIVYAPVIVALSPRLGVSRSKQALDHSCRLGGSASFRVFSQRRMREAGTSPFATLLVTDELSSDSESVHAMLEGYIPVSTEYLPALYAALREAPGTGLDCLPSPYTFDVPVAAELDGCALVRSGTALHGPGEYWTAGSPLRGVFRQRHLLFFRGYLEPALAEAIENAEGHVSEVDAGDMLRWVPPSTNDEAGPASHALPLRGLVPDVLSHGLNCTLMVPPGLLARLSDHLLLSRRAWGASTTDHASPVQHRAGAAFSPPTARRRTLSPPTSTVVCDSPGGVGDEAETEKVLAALRHAYRAGITLADHANVAKAAASRDAVRYLVDPTTPGVLKRRGAGRNRATGTTFSSEVGDASCSFMPGSEAADAMGGTGTDEDADGGDSAATTEGIRPFPFDAAAPPPATPNEPRPLPAAVSPARRGSTPHRHGGAGALVPYTPPDNTVSQQRRHPTTTQDAASEALYGDWLAFRRSDTGHSSGGGGPSTAATAGTSFVSANRARTPNSYRLLARKTIEDAGGKTPRQRGVTPTVRRTITPITGKKRQQQQRTTDYMAEFETKLEGLRQQVVRIADDAMVTGTLPALDESLLRATHLRLVKYLRFVTFAEMHGPAAAAARAVADSDVLAAADRMLSVIESTLSAHAAPCVVEPSRRRSPTPHAASPPKPVWA